MNSSLYVGHVGHRRNSTITNSFRYGLFMLYLDLTELDQVFAGRWFWSVEKPNWAIFRRRDHLRRPGQLDVAVRDEVARQLGYRPTGPVRLLTHLCYLGYCFNPISVYYCFAEDGATLEAIVVEIHNTPWGEEYLRALDPRSGAVGGRYAFSLDKEFHVSPFMPMDISYEWRFGPPGERLGIEMENRRGGETIFDAFLELERRPLSGGNLARTLLKVPFMTGLVVFFIYWQALRLKLKGAPFCPHPETLNVTKGLYTP